MSTSTLVKKLSMAAAGAAFVALGTGGSAQAIQIDMSAFGSGATIESFEGLSARPNVRVEYDGYGYVSPGVNEPFTFASGVTLTAPIPNPGINGGAIIGDWSIGYASFGLASNGSISSAADVPDGTAYLGWNNEAFVGSIEFTFASDVLRVGALVSGLAAGDLGSDGLVTLSAFDAFDNLLETVNIASVNVSTWSSNFLGLENTSGIRKVAFSGDYTVLDKLTFESAPESVPEPASVLGLLVIGTLGAGSTLKRQQSQKG